MQPTEKSNIERNERINIDHSVRLKIIVRC